MSLIKEWTLLSRSALESRFWSLSRLAVSHCRSPLICRIGQQTGWLAGFPSHSGILWDKQVTSKHSTTEQLGSRYSISRETTSMKNFVFRLITENGQKYCHNLVIHYWINFTNMISDSSKFLSVTQMFRHIAMLALFNSSFFYKTQGPVRDLRCLKHLITYVIRQKN